MTPRKAPPVIPLIAGLIDERLIGAACTGRAPLFDDLVDGEAPEDRIERHDAARRICRGCPVQGPCRTAASEHDPTGVWAAIIYNPTGHPGRPKKDPRLLSVQPTSGGVREGFSGSTVKSPASGA